MSDYRVYHCDCLPFMANIPDGSVDMIFTDPPYGINYHNGTDLASKKNRALGNGLEHMDFKCPIKNDGRNETLKLLESFLIQAKRTLKANGVLCCCCSGGGGPFTMFARISMMIDNMFKFKQIIVWDKGPMGLGWHYRRSYEFVIVAVNGPGKCTWNDTTNRIENIIRPGAYGIKRPHTVGRKHPTEKPVELCEHFIKLHSNENEIILDPFMGAGSTGLAALKNNRNFIGCELDEKYFNTAKHELKQYLPEMKNVRRSA